MPFWYARAALVGDSHTAPSCASPHSHAEKKNGAKRAPNSSVKSLAEFPIGLRRAEFYVSPVRLYARSLPLRFSLPSHLLLGQPGPAPSANRSPSRRLQAISAERHRTAPAPAPAPSHGKKSYVAHATNRKWGAGQTICHFPSRCRWNMAARPRERASGHRRNKDVGVKCECECESRVCYEKCVCVCVSPVQRVIGQACQGSISSTAQRLWRRAILIDGLRRGGLARERQTIGPALRNPLPVSVLQYS